MIEFLPLVLTGLSIAASILYYSLTIRNANRTRELQLKAQEQATKARQTQMFLTIYHQLNSKENWESYLELIQDDVSSYETFLEKYDSSVNRPHFAKRSHIMYMIHAIGELLKLDVVPIELINDLVGVPVITLWMVWGDIIKEVRVKQGLPRYYVGFEYLYDKLVQYQKENPEMMVVNYDIIDQIEF
jgi:hypothetical protein